MNHMKGIPMIYPMLILTALILPQEEAGNAEQIILYVAPEGRNDNPGIEASPLQTLDGARVALRRIEEKGLPESEVLVIAKGGTYRLEEGLVFEEQDSGHWNRPIIYRAAPGDEVILTGGITLDPLIFHPVKDPAILNRIIDQGSREKVLQADLKSLGLERFGLFDPIPARGFPHPIRPAPAELFYRDEPLHLARWPNEGFVKTGKVLDAGSIPRKEEKPDRPARFLFDSERVALWRDAPDAWLFGYWFHDWADESIPVASVDPGTKEIILAGPHRYGVAEGKPFFAENLLEEIDQPGEY
jgi:hypothetical protein